MTRLPRIVITGTGAVCGAGLKIDSIGLSGGNVTIKWTGSAVLQSSTDLKTWSVVTGAASPYSAAPSDTHRFFRLSQ